MNFGEPNHSVERTGMSRSAQCQLQRQSRLIPVAHLVRRLKHAPAMTTILFLTVGTMATLLVGCAGHSRRPAEPLAQTQPIAAPPASLASRPLFQTITIIETNPVVFVSGEVRQPGRLRWISELSLTNAVALAGGFTDFADKARLEIRRSDGSVERY